MNYTSLTPSQLAEIQQANRDLLQLSRERRAAHLQQQVAKLEAGNFADRQIGVAKNLLFFAHAAHQARRFTGEPITGWGAL